MLTPEQREEFIKSGKLPSAVVPADSTAPQPDNSQGQAAVNSFTKGASFGLKNKLQGAEAATGAQVRKIAPQAVVNVANKAEGTSLDATVNPYMRAAQALPGVGPAISLFNMIVAAGTKSDKESWGDTYARLRDKGAKQDENNHKNYPITTTAAEIAGSIPPTLLGGEAIAATRVGGRVAGVLADSVPQATGAASKLASVGKNLVTGGAKGAAAGGAYGAASQEGGDLGDKAKAGAIGALFGAAFGSAASGLKSAGPLYLLNLIKKGASDPQALNTAAAQGIIKNLNANGYKINTVQDLQKAIADAAAQDGLTPEQAIASIAKKGGDAGRVKETSPAVAVASQIHPIAGQVAQAALDHVAPATDSAGVTGLKSMVNGAPAAKPSVIVDVNGKPITSDAQTPLPDAPDQNALYRSAAAIEKAVKSDAGKVGGDVGGVIVDGSVPASQKEEDKSVDIDALLKSLNIDPNTPDGTQKKQSMSPTDHSDPTTQNRSEGQVSDDVPQITVVDGKKKLTTPSGQVVDLS